jgi:hypothetical protein
MNILFLVFNRPETTAKVFDAIKEAKPSRLFISADGPRTDKTGEKEKTEAVRKITESIDWPCEVHRNYPETNLGCRKAVSSGITWFFNQVDEGIILEDDTLPDQSFFAFAEEMLKTYRDKDDVMHINGTNFQFGNKRGDASYYFSRCPHVWGWASWRRAWKEYDVDMKDLDSFIESKKIFTLFKESRIARFWISLFKHIKSKHVDTWDAQWTYAVMKNSGIVITPNTNLVENIGLGAESTHTSQSSSLLAQKSGSLNLLTHPENIQVNEEADSYLAHTLYLKSPLKRLVSKILKVLKIG